MQDISLFRLRRNLAGHLVHNYVDIMQKIQNTERTLRLGDGTQNVCFFVKSYYSFLNFSGTLSPFCNLWKASVPLKVKVTSWFASMNRLNATDFLMTKEVIFASHCVVQKTFRLLATSPNRMPPC